MLTVLGQWDLWVLRILSITWPVTFLGWYSCVDWQELLEWDQLCSVDWHEWCLQEKWQVWNRVWLWHKAWQECQLAEGWCQLLWWLEEECEVCFLKLLFLSWHGGVTVIFCNVSYVWNHVRSVISPSGCGCNDASNEICCGGVVFLMEEFCEGSPRHSGQIHNSHNTGHQGSGSKMTCLSTDKSLTVTGHDADCRRC